MRLQNKVAIITGSGRGIGRATAQLFAKEGANVVVNDMDAGPASETVELIRNQGGQVALHVGDLSKMAEARKLVDTAVQNFGTVHILHNNAGTYLNVSFENMTEEQFDAPWYTNIKTSFNCTKAILPTMMSQKYGKIINVTSYAGLQGVPLQVNYCAAKAAVIGLTKALAKELGPFGIRVNCYAPFADTRMVREIPKDLLDQFLKRVPLGRVGQPEEIAKTALFLASEDSDYVTGGVFMVDGGQVIG